MESLPVELRGPESSLVMSKDVCRLWRVSPLRFARITASGNLPVFGDPLDQRLRLYRVGDLDKIFSRRRPAVESEATSDAS